ncbi:undecaprenyl-phosphate galactose phosphotransferase WbaP [Leadbettera azotonutricia]|uniref:Undecaprenyl-phosphate galactose phosphotransferase n=1 Tax=Leadbettera azotonutricia (strain ATCC BAA-888 / DSM 13862 / ZAS-9) TaxID=545695 RepID=F5YAT6_LEAAZ|nr:undecaprenyl-phosphate galactose phosphotransferase WbaP [Leadbettera azotonutricia]AEF80788.1 undecaprenyl-phosphate galactose phosphotransferase [Leadbettera azotonutricia ZAS-9]
MTLCEFDGWYRARYHRTSSALTATALIVADFFGVMVSFGAGFFLVNLYDMSYINFRSFVTYWPYLPIFILIFQIMNLYPGVSLAPADELRGFTIGSLMAHGGIIVSRYIEDQEFDAISVAFIISFIFSAFILMVCRDIMHSLLGKIKLNNIPAVVFGGGPAGQIMVDRLLKSKKAGYIPVVILDDNPECGDEYRGIPVIRDIHLGPELVARYNIKMAIVAMPSLQPEEMARLINYSVSAFRYNVLIPDFVTLNNIWVSVRDFDGILGLATSHRLRMPWNLAIKRLMDLTIVIIGGLALLPFFLFIALLVKLSSPGPVLYGHKRLGLNGKTFKAYKFRSMAMDADKKLEEFLASDPALRDEWEASRKLKNDPRVTGIGKLIRRTSLDEFPQLINVLKGEMSLVGPRPVVEAEVEKYGENYNRIFSVKPGLTGLWQVSGRSDKDYAERVSYDTYYLQSWSVWLDIWVIYKTPAAVLKGKGAY